MVSVTANFKNMSDNNCLITPISSDLCSYSEIYSMKRWPITRDGLTAATIINSQ